MIELFVALCGLLVCVCVTQSLTISRLRRELREWEDSVPFRSS